MFFLIRSDLNDTFKKITDYCNNMSENMLEKPGEINPGYNISYNINPDYIPPNYIIEETPLEGNPNPKKRQPTKKIHFSRLPYKDLDIFDPENHRSNAHFINKKMFDTYLKEIKPHLNISTIDAELEKYGNKIIKKDEIENYFLELEIYKNELKKIDTDTKNAENRLKKKELMGRYRELKKYGKELKKSEVLNDRLRCTFIALERALKFGPSDHYLAQAYADFNMQHKAAKMMVNDDNPAMAVRFIYESHDNRNKILKFLTGEDTGRLIKDKKMINKVLDISYRGISKLERNPKALQEYYDPEQNIAGLKKDWKIHRDQASKKHGLYSIFR